MKTTSVEEFCKETAAFMPEGISKETGHFNVFKVEDIVAKYKVKPFMPNNRRAYYKISFIDGRNKAEYANKVIDIEKNALLFATPKVPYHYLPKGEKQSGYFCIFMDEFLIKNKSGVLLDDLPIFKAGGYPVFNLWGKEAKEINGIFEKM